LDRKVELQTKEVDGHFEPHFVALFDPMAAGDSHLIIARRKRTAKCPLNSEAIFPAAESDGV
jgi:hypothetical protein